MKRKRMFAMCPPCFAPTAGENCCVATVTVHATKPKQHTYIVLVILTADHTVIFAMSAIMISASRSSVCWTNFECT